MQQQSNIMLWRGTWNKGNCWSFIPSQSKWSFGVMGSCCGSPGQCHFVVQREAVPSSCLGLPGLHEQLELQLLTQLLALNGFLTGSTQWDKYGEWCGEVSSNCQTSFHFSTAFGVTVLFSIVAFQFEEEFIETKEDLEKLRNGESVNRTLNRNSHTQNKRTTGGIF